MSEDKTLATFRIEAKTWKAFQERAKMSGTSASALLVDFIDSYLGGTEAPTPAPVVASQDELAELRKRIDSLEETVLNRLDKLEENQVGELVA